MKTLASTTFALVLSVISLGSALTGPALSQTNGIETKGPVTGQIESINDSTVIVRASDGTVRTYQVDPETVTSLKLTQGSTILVNPNLMTGVITRIGPQNVLVKLDSGETRYFIVTQEERGTLVGSERVVVTPDQRIVRAENYTLTAGDIALVQPIATATVDTTTSRTEVERSTATTESTEVAPPPARSTTEETQPPVRALW